MTIINVTDASFEQDVLKNSNPVVLDYWAPWCGPCKMIAPVLEEVASETAGEIVVAKMNVDDNKNTPAQFGIRGIPTLMVFHKGEVKATKTGANVDKDEIISWVKEAIA